MDKDGSAVEAGILADLSVKSRRYQLHLEGASSLVGSQNQHP